MTVGQLMEQLKELPRNADVVLSYAHDNDYHTTHTCEKLSGNIVMLETEENPTFESLQSMAESLYVMDYSEKQDNHEDKIKLEEFIE